VESIVDAELRMHAERTPNPNSIKWVLNRAVVTERGGVAFDEAVAAEISPLAGSLLEIDGVEGIMLGSEFVTVSKAADAEWADLAPPVVAALKAWAETGASALGPAWVAPLRAEDDEVVSRIRRILEVEVQPYVERDGGEIVFAGFEDGVVQVHLQGACAGCPSSSITLKLAIEGRLKEAIPEVQSVVAV
jgi:Fe-S cluster biogenesis protein NfuA